KFEAFKIDSLELKTSPILDFLSYNGNIPNDKWTLEVQVRQPLYFVKESAYVSGLDIILTVFEKPTEDDQPVDLIKIKAGIAGLFKVENNRFLEDNEKKIVLIHFPALLFPYLRSAITGLVASGGLGTFIFPLINIHSLIEDKINNVDIQ
ncbi:MAG: protein-export chaperone SecB, partial [Desulfamplus sp.]|nr:protein-export chaperone SecB [Desulfamplus sp.]